MPWSFLVWRDPSFHCCPLLSISTVPEGKAWSEVVARLRFSVLGLILVACGLLLGVGGLLRDPLGFSQEPGVPSDPEPLEEKDDGEEVTQLDHFTFLGVVSELVLSLFESRKDDKSDPRKVWGLSCSPVGKCFPQ